MTSRRKFLSDAFGIALVSARNWPIRADQVRSKHGESNSSTSNSGRTTPNTHRRGRKLIWSAAVSTNPNCCDSSVMLSQLETSRPRGSERVAFIAFGNFRSFTRYGCLVLGELITSSNPLLHDRVVYAPIPHDAPATIAVFFSGIHSFYLKGQIQYTTAIRPETCGRIYWTMVSIDTFGSYVSARRYLSSARCDGKSNLSC